MAQVCGASSTLWLLFALGGGHPATLTGAVLTLSVTVVSRVIFAWDES